MISLVQPLIGAEEIQAVNEVLRSGMIAQGPRVAALEQAFADYCGTRYALAVSSGTAALHSALYAAGVGLGDEVITTPFSFIATINSILFLGAKPVLVDIDRQTFNMDVNRIEAAITPRTKAILAVDLYGQPADMSPLKKLAQDHNLVIIEDAAQAVGATYKGKKTGSLGDIGCFSLYATKNMMCGEGGLITTNNQDFASAIKRFRQHGMTGPYEYAGLGCNYRLTDLQAAIAVEQLKKVDTFTRSRQDHAELLNQGLQNLPGIITPHLAANRTHAYHQYTIRITKAAALSRQELSAALTKREIGNGVYYPKPLHAYRHIANFGYSIGDFPEAELVADEVLSLPVHPALTTEQVKYVISTIRNILE